MKRGPHVLERRTVAQSRIFRIEALDLEFPGGVRVQYERLTTGGLGAVLIVPLLDPHTVLLIREYAAGTERYELALPKGRLEPHEDLFAAANRELMEEVGYGSRQLTHLTSLSVAPGYIGHITHVVLAEGLYREHRRGDEPEEIEVIPWRLDELGTLIERDDCTEARSIAALFLVRERIKRLSGNK